MCIAELINLSLFIERGSCLIKALMGNMHNTINFTSICRLSNARNCEVCLLDYLKKERSTLELAEGEDSEKVYILNCMPKTIQANPTIMII